MQQFDEYMTALLGEEEYSRLNKALEEPPVIAFRPNKGKGFAMDDNGNRQKYDPVPWSSSGYLLKERPAFTFDPLFQAGAYYVQEPSSMFIEQAIRTAVSKTNNDDALHVLDLCAAPGGKSTLIRTVLKDEDILVCNEPLAPRAQVLLQNMLKWGHENVIVTSSYPAQFGKQKNMFDIIAIDAPCSGEGMFRKESAAVAQWSPALTQQCATLQKQIVTDVWNALRPGGFLIYSTCTYNSLEDEQNVSYFCEELGAEVIEVPIRDEWNITGNLLPENSQPVYHFFPHKVNGEGFFLALLRKSGNAKRDGIRSTAQKEKLPKELKKTAEKWLVNTDNFSIMQHEETGYVLPADTLDLVRQLEKSCRILSAGIPLCEQKGHSFRPHHALSLSRKLRKEAFPMVNLDYANAIQYLRRESIEVPSETPRGMVMVAYNDVPLGFVNNLGTRTNNLFPAPWRILSTHAPKSFEPLF